MGCTSLGRKRNEELVLYLSNSLVPPKPTPSGYLPDTVYPRYELGFITYGIVSQRSFPMTFVADDVRTWHEELTRARPDLDRPDMLSSSSVISSRQRWSLTAD